MICLKLDILKDPLCKVNYNVQSDENFQYPPLEL